MVFIDAGDPDLQNLHIRVPKLHRIPDFDTHHLRNTRRQKDFVFPGHCHTPGIVVEINIVGNFPGCSNDVNISGLGIGSDLTAYLMEKQDFIGIVGHFFPEFLLLFLRPSVAEIDFHIIGGHIPELHIHDSRNGIPDAEARHQQSRTAADAHKHHGQPLTVAEDVADGNLIQEAQAAPQGRFLDHQFLACCWRFRANQLRRNLPKRFMATIPGHKQHGQRIGDKHSQCHTPVKPQLDHGLHKQHDLVGLPQDRRKNDAAQSHTQQAPQYRAASCIEQVLTDDGSAAVAQSLQGADLGPLLVHHTGHGGDADQRCHQQEEHREHPGHTGDNIRAAVQGAVTDVAVSVQNVDIVLCDLSDFFLCVLQLRSGIGKLLLRPGKFLLGLAFALLVIDPALGKRFPAFFQRCLALCQVFFGLLQFLFIFPDLLPAADKRLPCGCKLIVHIGSLPGDLLKALQNLLPALPNLLPGSQQLFLLCLKLGFCGIDLLQLGIQFCLLGPKLLCLGGIFLPFGLGFLQVFPGFPQQQLRIAPLFQHFHGSLGGADFNIRNLDQGIQRTQGGIDLENAGIQLGHTAVHFRQSGIDLNQRCLHLLGTCLQLRLFGRQLGTGIGKLPLTAGLGGGQCFFAVFQLLPVLLQLCPAVFDLPLSIQQLLLSLFQLFLAVQQLLISICQLPLSFLFLLVVFFDPVFILFDAVRICFFRFFPCGNQPLPGKNIQQRFDALSSLGQGIVVLLGIDGILSRNNGMDLRIIAHIKGFFGHIIVICDAAAAHRGIAPVHIHIQR